MSKPRDLYEGLRGDDVVALQQRLNQILLGKVPHIPETGYFGSITKSAVVYLQKLFTIEPAKGYVGPKTRAALNIKAVVIAVAPVPPTGPTPPTPAPQPKPSTQPPSPPPPANRTVVVPPSAWSWFNVAVSMQVQYQNPGVGSVVAQAMPTLRLRPFAGEYYQKHETHIELGLGFQYGLNSVTTPTDPRHTITILGQGALVDPFSWNRWHTQFFVQAGLAINGIPESYGGYDWYLTHYVVQAQTGGQGSFDIIPNRWNLYLQAYGGGQYDATSKEGSGILGAAFGSTVTF
jgi:hypothetical protein